MLRSRKLTLVVPGLIWPRQALEDLTHDLPTPALTAMLGRGRLAHATPADPELWLKRAFGLQATPPAAPLRLLGLGHDPGAAHWICLDPVNLGFVENNLLVGDPQHLHLTELEARDIAVSLAPTFSDLGEIVVTTPGQWHLRLHDPASPLPRMADLRDFIGSRANHGMILDAKWRSLLSEAQIQLHTHPVNLARAAKGELVVNSLWPWGNGIRPAPMTCRHDVMISKDAILLGLAKHCGSKVATEADAWEDSPYSTPLVILDLLSDPRRQGDGMTWRDALMTLDAQWFSPLFDALKSGKLAHLTLHATSETSTACLELSRPATWAFWRSAKPIASLAV